PHPAPPEAPHRRPALRGRAGELPGAGDAGPAAVGARADGALPQPRLEQVGGGGAPGRLLRPRRPGGFEVVPRPAGRPGQGGAAGGGGARDGFRGRRIARRGRVCPDRLTEGRRVRRMTPPAGADPMPHAALLLAALVPTAPADYRKPDQPVAPVSDSLVLAEA